MTFGVWRIDSGPSPLDPLVIPFTFAFLLREGVRWLYHGVGDREPDIYRYIRGRQPGDHERANGRRVIVRI